MRNRCCCPKKSSTSNLYFPSSSLTNPLLNSTTSHSFSNSIIHQTIQLADSMIMKWNPDTSTFPKQPSLFQYHRSQAKDFIKIINDLQKAMLLLDSENTTSNRLIVRAQNLMQIAMKRLGIEFHQILSINRPLLDPESVSTQSSCLQIPDEVVTENNNIEDDSISQVDDALNVAVEDLRLIAECMISSGYSKECVKIYKMVRKPILDGGIYRFGVEKLSSSQLHKMNWECLELVIMNCINAMRFAVKTQFNGERLLCDHVFAASDTIRASVYAEITKEAALILFGFPENAARNNKKLRENVFRTLDMYAAISELFPEIESIFSFESTRDVISQALSSLAKLKESITTALIDFESSIQKKHTHKSPVAGGGVHSLTIDAMNYLSLLADYSEALSEILNDSQPADNLSLPESYFDASDSDDVPSPAISLRFARLVLVLLCKLDCKSKDYNDVSLSYLFLANNLNYVVSKVRTSNLNNLLGDDWVSRHELKVKQFALSYERVGWGHVITSVPNDPLTVRSMEEMKECFEIFNKVFEQVYRKQNMCVVPDCNLRDEIKVSIMRKLLGVYKEFYVMHGGRMGRGRNLDVVKFAPEDLENYLSDLFYREVGSRNELLQQPSLSFTF